MTISLLALGALLPALVQQTPPDSMAREADPRETHLSNLRQLTFGGQNAEAYWSPDCSKIIYQAMLPGYPDEQIFTMNADGSGKKLVSTGEGRCTCSFFMPDGEHILFSSTHERNKGAQKPVDMSQGYVWMVNPDYALYKAKADGSGLTPLIKRKGYVAEATTSPSADYIAFTGDWEGDLEIYRADLDGKNVRRLTHAVGYDGGPFVSWDGKLIAYRRDFFSDKKDEQTYRDLLKKHYVRPGKLEIWVMNADGSNKRQVTQLGCASFAPFIHPDGKRLAFCSNYGDPTGREFDIFLINLDGTGLQRVTHTKDFDGFPMFSRDGKRLLFASNRFGSVPRETNIFVADWKD